MPPAAPVTRTGVTVMMFVLPSRAVQVSGVAEPAIPAGVDASGCTFRPRVVTAPPARSMDPGRRGSRLDGKRNLIDKQVNHLKLKIV